MTINGDLTGRATGRAKEASTTPLSDADWKTLAHDLKATGDEAIADRLASDGARRAFNVASSICGEDLAAERVLDDAFAALREANPVPPNPLGWYFKTVIIMARDFRRKDRRRSVLRAEQLAQGVLLGHSEATFDTATSLDEDEAAAALTAMWTYLVHRVGAHRVQLFRDAELFQQGTKHSWKDFVRDPIMSARYGTKIESVRADFGKARALLLAALRDFRTTHSITSESQLMDTFLVEQQRDTRHNTTGNDLQSAKELPNG